MTEISENESNQSVRAMHERHMAGGQACYFALDGNQLEVRSEQRRWVAAHREKASRLLDISNTDRFADLGCGEGYLTLFLAQQAGWNIGIDFVGSSLYVLKAQAEYDQRKLHLIVASGDDIPLPNASVSKLLCNHVLEHVLDDDAVIREIHRVICPGGRILIGIPIELSPQIRLAIRLRRLLFPRSRILQLEKARPGQLVPELIGRQSHIRFYSLQAMKQLLVRNGFRVLCAEGIGLSSRGSMRELFRRNSLLFGLSTVLGQLLPGVSDGVLVLAERRLGD